MEGMNYAIPQRGEKKQLLELSERNVKFFKMDRERQRGLRWQDSKLDLLNTIKNKVQTFITTTNIDGIDENVIELADIFTINNAKIRIGDKNDARSIENTTV